MLEQFEIFSSTAHRAQRCLVAATGGWSASIRLPCPADPVASYAVLAVLLLKLEIINVGYDKIWQGGQ